MAWATSRVATTQAMVPPKVPPVAARHPFCQQDDKQGRRIGPPLTLMITAEEMLTLGTSIDLVRASSRVRRDIKGYIANKSVDP